MAKKKTAEELELEELADGRARRHGIDCCQAAIARFRNGAPIAEVLELLGAELEADPPE